MSRRTAGALVAAAAALACLTPAPAGAASFAATAGCQEHQAFVDGSEAAVAARLPRHYTPVRDASSGRPLVFARGIRCREVTIDGRTAPATMASYGVVIESPDGRGCGSGVPVVGSVKGDFPPVCNWYVLSWMANDRRVVDWLRDGTPGFPAAYEPHLLFDLGAFDISRGGEPFRFQAPPFAMDEVARERPGDLSVRVGYWFDTPQGTVKIAGSTEDLTSGDASGTVRATHRSEMATLLGAPERPYVPGYSSFSAERWGHFAYRKQVLGPSQNTESFDGSCSFEGDVTFSPPAKNDSAALVYTYDSKGTCSGRLDGVSVSDAPVTMHQSGPAYGGCQRAMTTAPGQGTFTFADGRTIRYTLDFTTTGTEVAATFYGERAGWADAHATFATQRTPPDITVQCAGDGAPKVPMDVSLTTGSTLVSER